MLDPVRIDIAERLDLALDSDVATRFDVTDPVGEFVTLAAEIRWALQEPMLSPVERARIHARAVDLAGGHPHSGFRRAWPQLVHLGAHPAVVGGAAAAVLAVAGLVALRERRGHGGPSILSAA
jgi:hypothetical protein